MELGPKVKTKLTAAQQYAKNKGMRIIGRGDDIFYSTKEKGRGGGADG